MEVMDYLLLVGSAAVAGGINAVAGGGTLLTFPALLAILGPAQGVVANATSTVALFPGSLSAIWGYREDIARYQHWLRLLMAPSLAGGLAGALLLTELSPHTFILAVPWLILTAATLFALQPVIGRWMGIGQAHATPAASTRLGVFVFQFCVGVYGGYFGAGIGILMLSALAMIGLTDIHAMNGLKSILGSCINGIAVVVFVVQGQVNWWLAALMCVSASLGAYATARVARRLNRNHVRWFVTAIGFVLAAYYFYKTYAN